MRPSREWKQQVGAYLVWVFSVLSSGRDISAVLLDFFPEHALAMLGGRGCFLGLPKLGSSTLADGTGASASAVNTFTAGCGSTARLYHTNGTCTAPSGRIYTVWRWSLCFKEIPASWRHLLQEHDWTETLFSKLKRSKTGLFPEARFRTSTRSGAAVYVAMAQDTREHPGLFTPVPALCGSSAALLRPSTTLLTPPPACTRMPHDHQGAPRADCRGVGCGEPAAKRARQDGAAPQALERSSLCWPVLPTWELYTAFMARHGWDVHGVAPSFAAEPQPLAQLHYDWQLDGLLESPRALEDGARSSAGASGVLEGRVVPAPSFTELAQWPPLASQLHGGGLGMAASAAAASLAQQRSQEQAGTSCGGTTQQLGQGPPPLQHLLSCGRTARAGVAHPGGQAPFPDALAGHPMGGSTAQRLWHHSLPPGPRSTKRRGTGPDGDLGLLELDLPPRAALDGLQAQLYYRSSNGCLAPRAGSPHPLLRAPTASTLAPLQPLQLPTSRQPRAGAGVQQHHSHAYCRYPGSAAGGHLGHLSPPPPAPTAPGGAAVREPTPGASGGSSSGLDLLALLGGGGLDAFDDAETALIEAAPRPDRGASYTLERRATQPPPSCVPLLTAPPLLLCNDWWYQTAAGSGQQRSQAQESASGETVAEQPSGLPRLPPQQQPQPRGASALAYPAFSANLQAPSALPQTLMSLQRTAALGFASSVTGSCPATAPFSPHLPPPASSAAGQEHSSLPPVAAPVLPNNMMTPFGQAQGHAGSQCGHRAPVEALTPNDLDLDELFRVIPDSPT